MGFKFDIKTFVLFSKGGNNREYEYCGKNQKNACENENFRDYSDEFI